MIIPGSKNTLGDLDYLRRSGLAERIAALARQGTAEIVGICGGLQMLGREIRDPLGIESAGRDSRGLGLLDADTVMAAEKTLVRTTARHAPPAWKSPATKSITGRRTTPAASRCWLAPTARSWASPATAERVWGTYLHGVFDADAFRRWFIDRPARAARPAAGGRSRRPLRHRAGLGSPGRSGPPSVRMDKIYRLMGLR